MLRLCVPRRNTSTSLLATQDANRAPSSKSHDLQANGGLCYAAKQLNGCQVSYLLTYPITVNPSVYTPIFFISQVLIDGHRFPTAAEIVGKSCFIKWFIGTTWSTDDRF